MELDTVCLERKGWFPNNERLPVFIGRGVLPEEIGGTAQGAMNHLSDNGWANGIYSLRRYHAT